MKYPHFVGGSNELEAVLADQERTVNFYVERVPAGGTVEAALFPTPGVEVLDTAITGGGRAHWAQGGKEFAVVGTGFYQISSGGEFTSRGTVALNNNPATICSNGDGGGELFITSGGNGYIYDLTAETLTQISGLDGIADQGDQLDGYFLCLEFATSTMRISDLLDGTTWDSTQFAQRSGASDPWVAMKVLTGYIWLLGSQTSEVWWNAGTFPFPFEPHPSGLRVPYGCAAPFSPEVAQGALTWLGRSLSGEGMVLSTNGFTPRRISTPAVEAAIQGYTTRDDAIGDAYEEGGHTFFLLSFLAGGITWVVDITTGIWHERGTWYDETGEYVAWRALHHAYEFNQHRWLDTDLGVLYRADKSLPLDADARVIRRLRRAPAIVVENQRVFYSSMELLMDVGLGTQTGQGFDPQVMLRWSNNGGKTWSDEYMRGAGKAGEYGKRVKWNRLGAARKRVFEVSVTDPIPWRIMAAYLEIPHPPKRTSRIEQAQWSG